MLRFGPKMRNVDATGRSGRGQRHRAGFGVLLLGLLIWSALAGNAAASGPGIADHLVQTPKSIGIAGGHTNQTAEAIVRCLKQSKEAVLFPDDGVNCVDKRGADEALATRKADLPQMIDVRAICEREQIAPGKDKRVLDRMIIKSVAQVAANETIDRSGIRVIGAIFCNGLELTGIDLPYSLVLDRSVIWSGKYPNTLFGNIEARNMRIAGDFSVDDSRIYGNIRLVRSELAGSFYAGKTFANHVQIENSTIKGASLSKSLSSR